MALSEPSMLSQTLNGILPENDISPPHPALSPKGRGDQTEECRGFTAGHKKTAALGLRFFIRSTCCQQQDNRP